eukprot:jgi/Chrzof1/4598/Cz14g19200.t1
MYHDATTGLVSDSSGKQVGCIQVVSSRAELQAVEKLANEEGYIIMDAIDWQVIPAENLVATFQSGHAKLLGVTSSAAGGRVMLEALETGTAGVVLRTEDPSQVRALALYIKQRNDSDAQLLQYESATVTRVTPIGMGDRVCVDLCSLLVPGQGMLVGSFSRALFLVHSECMESQYINSRPFRVNAGPVHAYVQAAAGRTAYLSELASGCEVLVADATGAQMTAIVGRVKIESRPLVRAGA